MGFAARVCAPLLALVALAAAVEDGWRCTDGHNNCQEWSYKGECDKNAAYMTATCPYSCGHCRREAAAAVDASGNAVAALTSHNVSGVFDDPAKRWRGVVRNPAAAMDATASGGVEITIAHAYGAGGSVDVLWESDGKTRDAHGEGTKLFGMEPGERMKISTFEDHVFRVASSASGATLTSFKIMPNRPTFTIDENSVRRYASTEDCADTHPSCAGRASRGECTNAPGWMVMKCSRSCESCHLRDPELRCPRSRLNVRQVPGLLPGGVDALYENLAAAWPQFNVTIHSRPGGDPDGDDVADGPWIATFDNFFSEAEGAEILGTVNNQFSRSTDQGAVDKYGEQQKVVSTSRTSENAWCTGACESNRATRAVMARIEDVTGVPKENYESFQVLRYTHGQQYRAHHDMSRGDNALACGPRIYTFFMYFSDVEKGGETEFPMVKRPSGKTVKIAPKRGSALLWPSVTSDDPTAQDPRTRHAALPVVEGTKFAANAWIHMFDYNEPNIWGCTGAFD